MKRFCCIPAVLFGVAIAAASSMARATLLLPLTAVTPNAQATPLSGGNVLGTTGAEPFNVAQGGATFVGYVQEWLVNGYSGNPFGSTGLTFVIQATLTSGTNGVGGNSVIQLVSDSNFLNSPNVDVGYNTTGAQITPRSADRRAFGDTIGDAVQIHFLTSTNPSTSQITVGQSSSLLIINTNATDFVPSTLIVSGTLEADLSGFAPAPVPEPSSLLALCTAGATSLVTRRRRVP